MVEDSNFSLSDVVVTHRLVERGSRPADLAAELAAMHHLAQQLAQGSQVFLQQVADTALGLCHAGTAGLSFIETKNNEEVFVCRASSGAHAGAQGLVTPRNFSACGVSISQGGPVLFAQPARHFSYFQNLDPAIEEELVIPIVGRANRIWGTIWIASHDNKKQFDLEDVRVMTALANYVAAFLAAFEKPEADRQRLESHIQNEVSAREAVQNQRKWLEAVLDGLPLGLVMVEPGTGDYIFSNREAKKFFATDQPVEADTQSYRSTVHITDLSGNPVKPDQHPSVRAARGEKLVNEQVIRKNSAGSTYISCYSESLPAMFGHPETVIVPFIDVTSQKLAERELLDSQDRLLSLFQQAPLPICIMDGPEHKFVLMNPYYKTLLGEREMVGKTVREGLPELEGQGFFELLDGVYKTGLAHEGVEVQTHLTGKDGKLREAFFNFIYKPIFNAAGKVTGVMSVANDVTIQVVSRRIIQESEQNLRELADSMPQFVWAANPDGTLYYTNERWAAYSGSNDPSEWLSFVHPDDVARAVDVWMNSVRTGQLYEIEFRLKKADSQKYRWHLVRARPVRDSSGQIKRWYGTCTDIDEQREIQAELLSAKNQADTANQLKTAFLANMSHEIRTPLGAILGFTELLRTPSLSKSEHEQYLDVVARNGKALTRLIDDILDLSKVEAGRLNVEMVPFSLKQLINETVELFEDVSRTKGLSVEIIDPIPEMIESDPTRLRQILINILGNAIKFTQHGGVKIKASHELIEGKSKISIRVIDTGVGIETDQIAHLFQPFRQADNSTSRKFGGTGLGLALSRRLARALGGDVLISDCHEGHGCTFVINLVARLIDHVSTAKPPSRAVAPPATRRLDDLKILVIDDAADNRLLIKYILNHEGANVVEASDGDEGIARALHHQFDVVLMDIQMPGLDGYDCIRLLREQNYTKPVIALTAHAMKEERDRSLSSGFDDHVTKPIQKDVLVQSILKQISNKSSSSQLQV